MAGRVLLLIPHPDDEVVAAATAIAHAGRAGTRFWGLYLTTGVPAPDQLWRWHRSRHGDRVRQRRSEALAAAAALGIEPAGFTDWPTRTLKNHVAEASQLIASAITHHAIDEIWVPAWEGGHQDHDVANFLAARLGRALPVLEFAEYNFAGGTPNWQRFAVPNGTETILHLTDEEAQKKRRLLALYRSEKANLAAAGYVSESFRPLPIYDYRARPHPGKLLRERFHWVGNLFRHPRVDFEASARIYEALAAFDADHPA